MQSVRKAPCFEKYAQAFENQLIDALGTDAYAKYRALIDDSMGENSDQVMQNFYGAVGESYLKYANGPLKCTFKDGDPNLAQCEAAFKADVAKSVEQSFGENSNSDCRRATKGNMDDESSQAYCKKLAGYTQTLVGLDPGNLGKGFCPKGHVGNSRTPFYFGLLVENAFADSDVDGALCDLSLSTKRSANLINIGTGLNAPVVMTAQRNTRDDKSQSDDGSKKETDTPLERAPVGSHSGYESSGPARPDYSGNSTERGRKIERDLAHEDSVVGKQLGSITDKIMKTMIPTAEARTDSSPSEKTQRAHVLVPNDPVADPLRGMVTGTGVNVSMGPSLNGNSQGSGSQAVARSGSAADRGVASLSTGKDGFDNSDGPVSAKSRGGAAGGAASGQPGAGSGASGAQGAIAGQDKTTDPKASAADERALHALLKYLQRPYESVRKDLERPSVIGSLKRHFVQVVDSEGQAFGSGFPKHKLVYDAKKQRLVPKSGNLD